MQKGPEISLGALGLMLLLWILVEGRRHLHVRHPGDPQRYGEVAFDIGFGLPLRRVDQSGLLRLRHHRTAGIRVVRFPERLDLLIAKGQHAAVDRGRVLRLEGDVAQRHLRQYHRHQLGLFVVADVGEAEVGQIEVIADDGRNAEFLLASEQPKDGAPGLYLGRALVAENKQLVLLAQAFDRRCENLGRIDREGPGVLCFAIDGLLRCGKVADTNGGDMGCCEEPDYPAAHFRAPVTDVIVTRNRALSGRADRPRLEPAS